MPPRRYFAAVATASIVGVSLLAVACGSGSKTSAKSNDTTPTQAANGAGRGGRRFNGTPNPDLQTSIAEGTPPPFANRTPDPDVQTSIAEGTPPAFGRGGTPPAAVQTAIAQGTPASALRGGFGGFGGGRVLPLLATVLGMSQDDLQTALQAPGASIETVAAAHGKDRATLRQALILAYRQQLNDMVSGGMLTQDMADQQATQFESNLDSLIDRVGGFMPGGGGGAAPAQ